MTTTDRPTPSEDEARTLLLSAFVLFAKKPAEELLAEGSMLVRFADLLRSLRDYPEHDLEIIIETKGGRIVEASFRDRRSGALLGRSIYDADGNATSINFSGGK